MRSALGGYLVQQPDDQMEGAGLYLRHPVAPTAEQSEDLAFALKLAKHTRSNTIVLPRLANCWPAEPVKLHGWTP